MIIDAHHHLWDLGVHDQPWIDPASMSVIRRDFALADLVAETTAAGVDATILVQTVTVVAETPEFLAIAERSAGLVAGVVGWVDLTDPGVADALAELRAAPGGQRLVSIRHQVQNEPDDGWLARPDVRRGLRAVADAGLGYDLLIRPHQLPAAIDTVRALPELRFITDHLAKPPIVTGAMWPWSDDLRALAAAENVAAKISGLVTEADWTQWRVDQLRPYVEVAFEAFGPHRLMFGSDWPVCLLGTTYQEWLRVVRELTGGLSAAERTQIFAGTARRWYALA